MPVNNTLRLDDYEGFNSCDNEKCNRYFENENMLYEHLQHHKEWSIYLKF